MNFTRTDPGTLVVYVQMKVVRFFEIRLDLAEISVNTQEVLGFCCSRRLDPEIPRLFQRSYFPIKEKFDGDVTGNTWRRSTFLFLPNLSPVTRYGQCSYSVLNQVPRKQGIYCDALLSFAVFDLEF